jgi:hypothetical protein
VEFEGEKEQATGVGNSVAKQEMEENPDKKMEKLGYRRPRNGKGNLRVTVEF